MRRRTWPRRRPMGRWNGLLFSAALGIGLALAVICCVNARLRPILLEVAHTQTSNAVTAAINDAVAAQAVEYTDLITLEKDAAGNVIALTSNMARINSLRSDLLSCALEAVDGLELQEMGIPLGTLIDFDLFSGRGPEIWVKVLSVGAASAEFTNQFTEAGINQTRHQIFFDLAADVSILLPGEQCTSTIKVQVCVAETVIVGQVPATYLQIGEIP